MIGGAPLAMESFMMGKRQEADTRLPTTERRVPERIKDALRFTALGFLISLAFIAWTAMFWLSIGSPS